MLRFDTVFTPASLQRSVEEGSFHVMTLEEFRHHDNPFGKAFVFIFPSIDETGTNQANGDGDLLEIIDFPIDMSHVTTSHGNLPASKSTKVFYQHVDPQLRLQLKRLLDHFNGVVVTDDVVKATVAALARSESFRQKLTRTLQNITEQTNIRR
jgi:hypothetical protein